MDSRTIFVTGATGLVGARLLPALLDAGDRVRAATRSPGRADLDPRARALGWDGLTPPPEALEGCDAVVHLAGEPIFAGRLTEARKERAYHSRVDSARAIASALCARPDAQRPATWVCASAVGYYGSRGEEALQEDAAPGDGFLAELCRDWESATAPAAQAGVRVVNLRIGVVLAAEGGALSLMARPFRLGLGGRLGDGRQWFPWIHADDLVGLIRFALDTPALAGPVNAVAPEPARNADLTRELAATLGRPALIPVPAFAIRLALGELADELLGSRKVVPAAARAAGFDWTQPALRGALEAELG
jgi:uncharacterized protein (TIGR01777 family)